VPFRPRRPQRATAFVDDDIAVDLEGEQHSTVGGDELVARIQRLARPDRVAGRWSRSRVRRPRRTAAWPVDHDVSVVLNGEMTPGISVRPRAPDRVVVRVVDDEIAVGLHGDSTERLVTRSREPDGKIVAVEPEIAVVLIRERASTVWGIQDLHGQQRLPRPQGVSDRRRGKVGVRVHASTVRNVRSSGPDGNRSTVVGVQIYEFGPPDGPAVLALHGVSGHGKRWESFADEYLPEARVIAPDLRGHGRSPWVPPWNFETLVADAVEVIGERGPVLLVGHSFGGAIGLHLAASHPELVRGLVLLDPAIALPGPELLEVATATVESPDYTDAAEARSEKVHGAWADVDEKLIDAELAEHLIPTRNGRVGWRMSVPAIVAFYGELARDFVLPAPDLPTILVQALKVQPSYVTPAFLTALQERLGENLTVHQFDCDHMVAFAKPSETAALIRKLL
jgi:lipase